LEATDVDGNIILKWILNKHYRAAWIVLICLKDMGQVVGRCGPCNAPSVI
jgi:hypothetical protein